MKLPDFSALSEGAPDDPGCPSDFTLDQWSLGQLPEVEQASIEAHTRGCEACAARLSAREAGFDAFPDFDERAMLARLQTERAALAERPAAKLWAWLAGLVTLAVGAAALLLLLDRVPPTDPGGGPIEVAPEVTRFKGDVMLRVYRERAGEAEEAASGDTFKAGDRLIFEVDVKATGHLSIFGVEPSGAVYRAWPLPEHSADTLRSIGPAQRLPGAVVLDDTIGREVLHAVLCPEQVGPPVCTAAQTDAGIQCTDGCARGQFVMVKP